MTAPFITIVGAGGAGKSTLIHYLLEKIPNTQFLKLYTTRPPDAKRGESESSLEYNFVTQEQYQALKDKASVWEELNSGKHLYGVDIRTIEPQREQGIIFLSTMILEKEGLEKRLALYRPPVIFVLLKVSHKDLIARGIPRGRISRKNESIETFTEMSSLTLIPTEDLERDLADALNQFQKLIASFTTNPS